MFLLKKGQLLAGKNKIWIGTNTIKELSLAGHTHSEYAAVNHTHSGYAATNHTHSQYVTEEQVRTIIIEVEQNKNTLIITDLSRVVGSKPYYPYLYGGTFSFSISDLITEIPSRVTLLNTVSFNITVDARQNGYGFKEGIGTAGDIIANWSSSTPSMELKNSFNTLLSGEFKAGYAPSNGSRVTYSVAFQYINMTLSIQFTLSYVPSYYYEENYQSAITKVNSVYIPLKLFY